MALLEEGLALEPNDAELLGLGGLFYTLESIRHDAGATEGRGDFASERIRKLSKLSIDERSDGTLEEIKALKQRVFESSSQGTQLDNQAGRNTLPRLVIQAQRLSQMPNFGQPSWRAP